MKENDTNKEINEREEDGQDIELEELNEDGEITAQQSVKKLKERIKELEKESKENLDGWMRAKADYSNFSREVESRRRDDIKLASRNLIEKILPSLDSYYMAKSNEEAWNKVDANWRIGIEHIFNQLINALEGEGLTSYGVVGDKFNPELHDSIEIIETEDRDLDGKISKVLSMGYKLGENIIRHAKVKVYHFKN